MPNFHLASFVAEVTPPLGHPLMGGGIRPAERVDDPLFLHGVVLLGAGAPLVLAAIDWCEIRNDAYDQWRQRLAESAHTTPERVLFSAIHQHDAPIADLAAQKLLEEHQAAGSICDLAFHDRAVQAGTAALRASLAHTTPITHLGTGQAKVDSVASNRRCELPDGTVSFSRMSATSDATLRAAPDGTIDPCLKTLSFWNADVPVAALSFYATHPMSYYGKGGVSADFVGLARRRRATDDPRVAQLYFSGCSGNVTAGKYNDGSPDNRQVLADRLYRALRAAWEATERHPLDQVEFREIPLRLEPRDTPGFTLADLERRLETDPKPFGQCLAALGLSWRRRIAAGRPISLPLLDFGPAQYLLLPGEAYVEHQLAAQDLRPDSFVVVAGYGESATGYIPTDRHFEENDPNLHDWCWVAKGSEARLRAALATLLGGAA